VVKLVQAHVTHRKLIFWEMLVPAHTPHTPFWHSQNIPTRVPVPSLSGSAADGIPQCQRAIANQGVV